MRAKAGKTTSARSSVAEPVDQRQRILDAARRRFAASGFESTTVRQIADDVGLLAGSLYHHFANKDEILREAVREAVLRLREGAKAIWRREVDAETKLVALIFFDVDERVSDHETHAILFQERTYFRHNADLAYAVGGRREHYLVWRRIIEQGIEEGAFRADVNLFLTISTIIRMLNTAADWYLHDEPATKEAAGILSREELSAFHVDFVLRALRVPARLQAPVPWPIAPADAPSAVPPGADERSGYAQG